MKNKPDSKLSKTKTYKAKVAVSIIYSTLITLVLELLLIYGLSFSMPVFEVSEVIMLILTGIVVFAVSFWLLHRRAFEDIEKLSGAVKSISEGDLNPDLDISEDNEFSEIAYSLNLMTKEIKDLIDRERESERSKNELITNIAHDLRTPLTSILGYLELLSLKQDLPAETGKQYIDIAFSKTKKLQKLIEDLFGFTKLTYGKIAMKVERIDLVKLLSQLMDEFYPNFMQKDLDYDLTSNTPMVMINADPNLLARLFDNLINNAIKYGAEGKCIHVKITENENDVEVRVINYGKVIPEDELPMIFEKFYRVEQSRSVKTGGTGLGLAIAKNIVEMHGGTIKVESDLNGTRFIVSLKKDFDINKENFDSEA